jgi:excisionase family DNA binding protein
MQNIPKKAYFSIAELAKLLKISRIAVFKKIKKGQIPAEKVGRSYIIAKEDVDIFFNTGRSRVLSEEKKKVINKAVAKVVKEYGETLKLLAKE